VSAAQTPVLRGGYQPTPAEWATWDIGNFDPARYRRFRQRCFRSLPGPLADAAADRYRAINDQDGFPDANTYLRELAEDVGRLPVRIALSNDELKAYAKRKAEACAAAAARCSSPETQHEACQRIARAAGLGLPSLATVTLAGALARARCQYWWRRQLRKTYLRAFEARAIEAGLVGRQAGLYASDETVRLRREQKARNRALLESATAVNELAQEYTLAELADRSVSNPSNRRGELMVRLNGFESIARERGDAGEFYTITCPGRMHARHHRSGTANPNYDGTTPRAGQAYLRRLWARARAALHHRGIRPYGFRIAEPQHDGTPHWHILLFMPPEQVPAVRDILRRYALQDSPDEPGADEHRFDAVAIDWSRGTAAGYVAKYVAKNIDGEHVGLDEHGNNARSSAERVEARASRWGIRQFQQIGGPPVWVWRELRRASGEHAGLAGALVRATDQADWPRFVTLMGGPAAKRAAMPASLMKSWSDQPGQYGEALGWRAIGVNVNGAEVVTREHSWTINYNAAPAAPPPLVSLTGASSARLPNGPAGEREFPVYGLPAVNGPAAPERGGSFPPRSSVNKCTVSSG